MICVTQFHFRLLLELSMVTSLDPSVLSENTASAFLIYDYDKDLPYCIFILFGMHLSTSAMLPL